MKMETLAGLKLINSAEEFENSEREIFS